MTDERNRPSDAADTAFDPSYGTQGHEFATRLPGGASIARNRTDGSLRFGLTREHDLQLEQPGLQARYALVESGAITIGRQTLDDAEGNPERIDYALEGEFGVAHRLEASAPSPLTGTDVSAQGQSGVRARYRVSLPIEASEPGPGRIDPLDPTSLPPGGRMLLDAQAFQQVELEGVVRYLGTQDRMTRATGESLAIERLDGATVRVARGPNAAVESLHALGLKSDLASVMVGRQDALGHSRVETAQFDITTAEGRSAYQGLLQTGQVRHDAPGVSDVATVERIGYTSQTRLQLELGPVSADLGGRSNAGSLVRTERADGAHTLTEQYRYGDNVPLTVVRQYGGDGKERLAERSYRFDIATDVPDPGWLARNVAGRDEATEERNLALNLEEATGARVAPGATAQLDFTQAQMQALMLRAGAGAAATQPADDAFDFALNLARKERGTPYDLSNELLRLSGSPRSDTYRPIDVQVHTEVPGQPRAAAVIEEATRTGQTGSLPEGHRDHALYRQGRDAVHRLDADLGRQPDALSERMAMFVAATARESGLERIDSLVLGDRGLAFALQGPPDSPAHLRAAIDVDRAIATPVEDSASRLGAAAPVTTQLAEEDLQQVLQRQAAQR